MEQNINKPGIKGILSIDDFEESLKKRLTVIDFYTEWCAPCKLLKPQLEKMTEKYKEVFFYKLDAGDEKFEEVCKIFNIVSVPTICIFHNGKLVQKIIGSEIDVITKKLDKLVGTKKLIKE
jgi:thioredoxin 1